MNDTGAKRDGPFMLTPFGAALVEALPDRKAVQDLQRTFKRSGRCPTSVIFPTPKSIREFYKKHGGGPRTIAVAVLPVVKGRRSTG